MGKEGSLDLERLWASGPKGSGRSWKGLAASRAAHEGGEGGAGPQGLGRRSSVGSELGAEPLTVQVRRRDSANRLLRRPPTCS